VSLTTFDEFYGPGKFGLSFELFPPKTPGGMNALFRHLDRLMLFKPSCITCTYGAGGSTRDRTLEVISAVREKLQVPVATHLTCVSSTVDQLREYLTRTRELKIENVVALRGDPPSGEKQFQAVADGFSCGNELVEFIREEFPEFGIAVGGYPETHQEAPSAEVDMENLKRKIDAGADVVITQLYYDNRDFFDFYERCEKERIQVPIVPGLLPVTNGGQIKKITSMCGARIPKQFLADLQKHEDGSTGQFEVGVDQATRQTAELLSAGVPGLHFYVLNKSEAAERVLSSVSLPR